MIANSRIYFTDSNLDNIRFMCTPNGIPAGDQRTSCIVSTKNRATTVTFFDTSAKNVPGVRSVRTVTDDMWGSVTRSEQATPGFTNQLVQDMNNMPEWRTGL
ncbi:MAG: hypothetical protein MUC92_01990 [Fimbriimonadaceae bacterium]|jgi:hypothetical protein|nr:hypothetical protein [Fimbriimonadaceae bacterium]